MPGLVLNLCVVCVTFFIICTQSWAICWVFNVTGRPMFIMARATSRPFFLTSGEVDKIFQLKAAGHKWRVIATRLRRPLETVRKRYYREKAARERAARVFVPEAILGHRAIFTAAETFVDMEYDVQWRGHRERSWEPRDTVQYWDIYRTYNTLVEARVLVQSGSRVSGSRVIQ